MTNKRKHVSKRSKVERKIHGGDLLPAKMARSLLPSLSDILSSDEIDKLDGPLRRGDISVLQSPFLLQKLSDMRIGKLNNSNDAFSRLYQFCSFLKKLPIPGNDDACKRAGLEKFKLGEKQCKETNERLLATKGHMATVTATAQQIVSTILGKLPANFLRKKVIFGPGSTVNASARTYAESGKFFKFSDPLLVPRRQKRFLAALMSDNYSWMETLKCLYHINDNSRDRIAVERDIFSRHLVVVEDDFANKISFVNKTSEEHRAIGVELNGSVLLQKVLGDSIRQALLKFGLDLNSQARNQYFARVAKTFQNATIDVFNASNTLSYQTVKLYIPQDWFSVLDCFRSHYGANETLDFTCKYEMFSSMGNGFTFELESLIFYALSLATVMVEENCSLHLAKRQVAVYGDDIIVPQTSANRVVKELEYIGFKTNADKSFLSGNFFESCGGDFYDGKDVRPFFLKRQLCTVKDIYFLCNSLIYKCIKSKSNFLFTAYLEALKSLKATCKPDYGPLHFEENKQGYRETYDDLEAVLRVPLVYAQLHGGVEFNSTLYAWAYKKWVNVSIDVPLSLNRQYAVQAVRYLTFLDGTLHGRAVLTGRTRQKLVKRYTSSWDGTLNRRTLSAISAALQI